MRRRSLAPLLAVTGVSATVAGCSGPAPVPTSADVARDPMAALDPAAWTARSAQELRALPIQGEATELAAWGGLGQEDAHLDPARDALMAFLETAYLDPASLQGLDDAATLARLGEVVPEFWADTLPSSWDEGLRHLYAFALAEPFRTVGRPWICADWLRAERDGGPALALGAVIAWTVIDTTTRSVGVLAHQLGAILALGDGGEAIEGGLRVVVHGLDLCTTEAQGGLIAPALGDEERHRAVQETTLETVLSSPRIPRETLQDEESELHPGAEGTVVADCP